MADTRQRNFFFKKILCRVPPWQALGKEIVFLKKFFAERRHWAKNFF